MAVPLGLVAAAGVVAALALVLRRVGWPADRAGELTLAVVGPLAVLLGALGAWGLLHSLVDLTSPTLLPLALAYASLPGLLVLAVGWAVADAPARRARLVSGVGVLVLVVGNFLGAALPIPDGWPGLVGLGLLLVVAPAPVATRDPGWTPPRRLGRPAAVATATVMAGLVLVAAYATVFFWIFGAPQGADYRWEVTVETPASGGEGASVQAPYGLGVNVPFLVASAPAGEAVLEPLRNDVHVASDEGGTRLLEDGRAVEVLLDPGQTVTVGADLSLWGSPEHRGAFLEHRLPRRNVSVDGAPAVEGNLTVTWAYQAEGNRCGTDVRLTADVAPGGNATLAGGEDRLEDGRLQAWCA